ncbi:MFS transporter [Ruania alba]|uniref:Major Facilitator Superfamily protein n=1 Tax=Ruania alba TaxID=648782 RepID=A0A1H5M5A3_9MICO|nr:MFS transporter [Ruania alba]SEE84546.1 Major Facilitator Superfamily protein [Ruania alba]
MSEARPGEGHPSGSPPEQGRSPSDGDAQGAAPPGATPPPTTTSRVALARWLTSYASFAVPQAAAPIAFALVALPLTGTADSGAAMVLAMTAAQVIGAVPVTRITRRIGTTTSVRLLVAIRTVALVAVALLAHLAAPFPWLVAAAAAAGLVSGAAYGHLRTTLNHVVQPWRLPRALGIAATMNEVVFVSAPALASLLGSISAPAAVLALAVLGAGSFVLVPRVASAAPSTPKSAQEISATAAAWSTVSSETAADATPTEAAAPTRRRPASLITPEIALWLLCATAGSAAVAGIEVGAVSLAIRFGLTPAAGFLFATTLCLASVAGGIWVSARNRTSPAVTVVVQLLVTTVGTLLIAVGPALWTTLLGAVLVGALLAPLGTHYSLTLDRLAPEPRRAEVFALLRTAQSLGIIAVSGLLTLTSLPVALAGSSVLMAVATLAAASGLWRSRRLSAYRP